MKKILILLLLFVSTQSFGAWSYFSKSNFFNLYIDKSAITTIKNNKRIWLLYDFFEPQKMALKNDFLNSQVMYFEFNCIEKTFKLLQVIDYQKSQAEGKVLDTTKLTGSETNNEKFVIPNTTTNDVFQFVCNK
jgi:hypothetical protein